MTCWQKLLNAGDYHGALASQGRPSFTPGDGSWSDFLFRLMHYTEKCEMEENEFLSRVSECTLTVKQHDLYWKCYVDLCRYFQQPIQPCVYHTEFWRIDPREYARTLAQRGDIEGINIVAHYYSLQPNWEWVDLFPCTLEPRCYLHLIPWNNVDVEERLIKHIQRHNDYTGQVMYTLIDAASEYLPRERTCKLKKLREEYNKLRSRDMQMMPVEMPEMNKEKRAKAMAPAPTACPTTTLSCSRRVQESVETWQDATCHSEEEGDTVGLDRSALKARVDKLQSQVSGIQTIVDSIHSFLDASKVLNSDAVAYREFLQDLSACLETLGTDAEEIGSIDIAAEKQALCIARLKLNVTRLQSRPLQSRLTRPKHEGMLAGNANQVSFSSVESLEFSDEALAD